MTSLSANPELGGRRVTNLVAESIRRKEEALRLYRPRPEQLSFHLSRASEKVMRGGVRCLAGEQQVYDPVLGRMRRVDSIDGSFHVLSKDPDTGLLTVAEASRPFVKAVGDIYEARFSNGEVIRTTPDHRLLDSRGRWISIREAYVSHATLHVCDDECRVFAESRRACPSCDGEYPDRAFLSSHPPQFKVGVNEASCHLIKLTRIRQDKIWDFSVDSNANYAMGGLIHANSGKTTATIAEVASAATGIPLCGCDGKPLPFLYPKERPLLIWVIGFDLKHIGRLYKKLFEPGLFRIIKDLKTGRMRTWRPWEEEDQTREAKTKPSPPMIPRRFCDPDADISYESKGERQFTVARLKNGTEIHAFPSGAEPGQGEAVDIILIDEDIKFPRHIDEWQSRLSDANPVFIAASHDLPEVTLHGRLLWSAWPHTKNNALIEMSRRAQEQRNRPNPDVFEKVLWMSKNAYVPKEEVRKRLSGWGPTISRSRDKGEFLLDTVQVFPDFSIDIHSVGGSGCPAAIAQIMQECRNRPPNTWTHYLGLDCGIAHPAILVAACPPPHLGDFVVVYDEIFLDRMTADELAKEAATRYGNVAFEAFIIDFRAGRQTQVVGTTQEETYAQAFGRHGLRCRRSGTSFAWGMDNITARNEIVRDWLRIRHDDSTKLLLVADNTTAMQREFDMYSKRIVRDEARDEVVDSHNHCMDTLGYIAGYEPKWVEADPATMLFSPAYAAWLKMQEKRGPDGGHTIHMGAGSQEPEYQYA